VRGERGKKVFGGQMAEAGALTVTYMPLVEGV